MLFITSYKTVPWGNVICVNFLITVSYIELYFTSKRRLTAAITSRFNHLLGFPGIVILNVTLSDIPLSWLQNTSIGVDDGGFQGVPTGVVGTPDPQNFYAQALGLRVKTFDFEVTNILGRRNPGQENWVEKNHPILMDPTNESQKWQLTGLGKISRFGKKLLGLAFIAHVFWIQHFARNHDCRVKYM